MTTMQVAGELLRASADDRTLTYRLLPYSEGRTSLGKVLASRGCLTLPQDPADVKLNDRHIASRELGHATRLEWGEDALLASFHVDEGPAGDALLEEAVQAKENPTPGVELRASASVEVDGPVIRAGKLLAGFLSGAAAVVRPAFAGASLLASDVGESDDTEGEAETTESEAVADVIVLNGQRYVRTSETSSQDPPAEDDAEQSAESETEMGETLTAAAAAGTTHAPHGGDQAAEMNAHQAFKLLAGEFKRGGKARMLAALANVTHDDGDNDGDGLGEVAAAPGWLGEVWAARAYQRKYIPLIGTGTLTSYRETGFRFATKPEVEQYSGNKAEIPTGGMTAEPVDFGTVRWAHGADLDRRFIDFGDTDVIRAFVEAQVESYARVTDVYAHDQIVAAATAYTPGTVPTGINATIAAIIDGALELIADDFRPTFAIVGSTLYRDILLTPRDDVTEYLSSAFGLEEGSALGFRIVPSAHTSAVNQVVVGDGSTLRLKEFGGGTPVRVEAEHVANGGRDLAVFGYTSFQELVSDGVRIADLTPAG